MKRQKQMNEFGWPFAKHRQTWIDSGDRLSGDAADKYMASLYEAADRARATLARKSAKLYEHASAYYKRAGLGLASRNAMSCASECWEIAGDATRSMECELIASETETYYEDEDDGDE